jgi:AcrR family transcriptional regulator
MRADAARNRQLLIDAAERVFATRGLDATLDDIALEAGVNVATAYRHFANKHELAGAFLRHSVARAAVLAEQAAAVEDPGAGFAQFLDQALQLIAANRGLADLITSAYEAELLDEQMHDLITGPIRRLVTRAQQAGAVRSDVDATDVVMLLALLCSVADRPLVSGVPEPTRRYLSLVLAGLRPDGEALPGRAPTEAELRGNTFGDKARGHSRGRAPGAALT